MGVLFSMLERGYEKALTPFKQEYRDFYRTRRAIRAKAAQEAVELGATCESVAREFIRRHGLNNPPVSFIWARSRRQRALPAEAVRAVQGLLKAHCLRGTEEYAPEMAACALVRYVPDDIAVCCTSAVLELAVSDTEYALPAQDMLARLLFLMDTCGASLRALFSLPLHVFQDVQEQMVDTAKRLGAVPP